MKNKSSNLLDSVLDAFSPGNLIYRILMFIVFGLFVGLPYTIKNLDKVSADGGGFVSYLFALSGSMSKGLLITLSTIWKTLMAFIKNDFVGVGSIIFSVFGLIFATMFFYQPIRLLFNALDGERDRKNSAVFVFLISLVLTLIIFAPLSSAIVSGETITTGVVDNDSDNVGVNETETINDSTSDDVITNNIDMLNGGGV